MKPAHGFPFREHRTLAEVDLTEELRRRAHHRGLGQPTAREWRLLEDLTRKERAFNPPAAPVRGDDA